MRGVRGNNISQVGGKNNITQAVSSPSISICAVINQAVIVLNKKNKKLFFNINHFI